MRILIVDDEQWRHDLYDKVYIGHEVVHTCSADEAIAAIKNISFDVIQLDHDLADEHYQNLNGNHEKTGYDVACYIEQHPELWGVKVVIHSLNPAGRSRMFAALKSSKDVQIIPVTQMMTGR